MVNNNLKLLDCTLRDGGYVNDWNWGFHNACSIIRLLTKAEIDYVEVGFLRNVDKYDENITVCNRIEELNRLLPAKQGNTRYAAMAMRSNYDIEKLSPYSGSGIELIRVTAHEYDIEEGLDFARKVKQKGYKVSFNPINIMGYSDEQLLWILKQVNDIHPYQFSIVDTFGSMKRRDLDRIVSLVDHNLDRSIRVALHLHENMSLSSSLAQLFIDKHLSRPVAIDGSLMGMGRIPGNLPIELIADYCNDYVNKVYNIDFLMDAIQDYICKLKGKSEWGYTPAYFLSARYNLHRNYAEYYLDKGDLTHRDINHILASFDSDKAAVFDEEYANNKYNQYKNNEIDDSKAFGELKNKLEGKEVLIVAPGPSIIDEKNKIDSFLSENKVITISINFIPEEYRVDYAFFSNAKRFEQALDKDVRLITTSNIIADNSNYILNYNSLVGAVEQGYNSYVMLIKLLSNFGVKKVYVAGADGYSDDTNNYYKSYLHSNKKSNYNDLISRSIEKIGIEVHYITKTAYM